MKPTAVWELLKQTCIDWYNDNTFVLGAALAYYTVFSIAPVLIIAIAVAGLIFSEETARLQMTQEVSQTVGAQVAGALNDLIRYSQNTQQGILATIVSVIALIVGATSLFAQLQYSLDTIWNVQPQPGRGLWGVIRDRVLSFAIVLGSGFLLLVSLVVSAALSALGNFLSGAALPGGAVLWQLVNAAISFGFITLLFAMIYKLLPDVHLAWRDVWIGAAVTALLFTVGKHLIGLYLGRTSAVSPYGAAGSLVVMLLWVYYSSQLLLLGAEFTQVYACRSGKPIVPSANAELIHPNQAGTCTSGGQAA
jgi:membrane protein